jgi:hypothetical protein
MENLAIYNEVTCVSIFCVANLTFKNLLNNDTNMTIGAEEIIRSSFVIGKA